MVGLPVQKVSGVNSVIYNQPDKDLVSQDASVIPYVCEYGVCASLSEHCLVSFAGRICGVAIIQVRTIILIIELAIGHESIKLL